jgi:hypothetical protein
MSEAAPGGRVVRQNYGTAVTGGREPTNLGDILERVLDRGVVIAGDIRVNLLDIELLTIKLRLLIASVDTARELGIDWWEHDPWLTGKAAKEREPISGSREPEPIARGREREPIGSGSEREAIGSGREPNREPDRELAEENRRLRARLSAAEEALAELRPLEEPETPETPRKPSRQRSHEADERDG